MNLQNKITISCMVLILGFQAACSRILNSDRNKSNRIQKVDMDLSAEQSEWLYDNHIMQFSDSSNTYFRIEIFPMDTFSFSLKDGFKGIASKIELKGVQHNLLKVTDSASLTLKKDKSLQLAQNHEMIDRETSEIKRVKRTYPVGYTGFFLIGCIIVIYGIYLINKRYKTIRP